MSQQLFFEEAMLPCIKCGIKRRLQFDFAFRDQACSFTMELRKRFHRCNIPLFILGMCLSLHALL